MWLLLCVVYLPVLIPRRDEREDEEIDDHEDRQEVKVEVQSAVVEVVFQPRGARFDDGNEYTGYKVSKGSADQRQ